MHFNFEDEYTENYLDIEALSDTDVDNLLKELTSEKARRESARTRSLITKLYFIWDELNSNGIALYYKDHEVKKEELTFGAIESD